MHSEPNRFEVIGRLQWNRIKRASFVVTLRKVPGVDGDQAQGRSRRVTHARLTGTAGCTRVLREDLGLDAAVKEVFVELKRRSHEVVTQFYGAARMHEGEGERHQQQRIRAGAKHGGRVPNPFARGQSERARLRELAPTCVGEGTRSVTVRLVVQGLKTPGFMRGLTYPLRGMKYVFIEHPKLARFWIAPIAIVVSLLVGLVTLVARNHEVWLAKLWSPPSGEGAWNSVLSWTYRALDTGFVVVAVLVGSVIVVLASSVIAAPFNDALSAEVERLEGRRPPNHLAPSLLLDLLRSVVIELVKVGLWFTVMVPLLVLNVVAPLVGGPTLALVGPLVAIAYIALDYTDWPAARRGLSVRVRLHRIGHNSGPLLGFGLVAWTLLWVPGLNLFLMPGAVTGGTLLYLDLETDPQDT